MKYLLFVFAASSLMSGCKATPVAQPTIHITMVDECADVSATGVFQGREYALGRPAGTDFAVACYGTLRAGDVGKDMPATLDETTGVLTVATPSYDRPTRYVIEAAREAK